MKEYVRKKVCEMLEEVEPGCLVGPAKDNETIADIFGISPVKGNEFIVFLKIVELTVGLENNLRIIIKNHWRASTCSMMSRLLQSRGTLC